MGISRDSVCGDRIGFFAEMGALEEELTVFGCCYLKDDKMHYRVSRSQEEVSEFFLYAVDSAIVPTPIHFLTERRLLMSGEQEAVIYDLEKQLARQLKKMYPREFFMVLKSFMEQEPDDMGWLLLQKVQNRIEGYFIEDELYWYEVILRHCLRKKIIRTERWREGYSWLKKQRNQMKDDTIVKEKYCRTFYGFVYEETATCFKQKIGTDLMKLIKKKIELEHDGQFVSPIFKKTFWFANNGDLPKQKRIFENWLNKMVGEAELNFLRHLNTLPSAIDGSAYKNLYEIDAAGSSETNYVMDWYANVWNIKKIK